MMRGGDSSNSKEPRWLGGTPKPQGRRARRAPILTAPRSPRQPNVRTCAQRKIPCKILFVFFFVAHFFKWTNGRMSRIPQIQTHERCCCTVVCFVVLPVQDQKADEQYIDVAI